VGERESAAGGVRGGEFALLRCELRDDWDGEGSRGVEGDSGLDGDGDSAVVVSGT